MAKNSKKKFPISISIQIPWVDIDIYGKVNESHYCRYFDATRIKYFEKIEFYNRYQIDGLAGVVSKVSCKYIIPVKYPSLLNVEARVLDINKESILMEHSVSSSNVELVVMGESEVTIFNHKLSKKVSVPDFLIESIELFENRKFNN